MEFCSLAEGKSAIPQLAKWYHAEWGAEEGISLAEEETKLSEYLNTHKIPYALLALLKGEPVGVAQLKYREMNIFPELEHWLGGVYVPEKFRGHKIAECLIQEIVSRAIDFGVKRLYLQTERLDGGIYGRLGWKKRSIEHYRERKILVMERVLGG